MSPLGSYPAWWFGSSSCCTGPPLAASRVETRGPWSFLDSTVYAWARRTSAPAGTWCRRVACGSPCSSPPPGNSSAGAGRWRRPGKAVGRRSLPTIQPGLENDVRQWFIPAAPRWRSRWPWCCWGPRFPAGRWSHRTLGTVCPAYPALQCAAWWTLASAHTEGGKWQKSACTRVQYVLVLSSMDHDKVTLLQNMRRWAWY